MKKILLFLLLSFQLFAQETALQRYFFDDETPIQKEAAEFKSRVEADGGIVFNFSRLNDEIYKSKADGSRSKYAIWGSPLYGVKINANNKVLKLYDVFGKDLVQSDTSKAPTLVWVNGKPVIRFDGVNDYLKSASMTLNQPTVVYIGIKQLSWATPRAIFDGYTGDVMSLVTGSVSPRLKIASGNVLGENSNLPLNKMGLVKCVFNGVNSALQIDNTAALTGNAGTSNGGGLTLGAWGGIGYYTNIELSEIRILLSLPTTQQDTNIKNSMNQTWGIY
ncbi:MAG: hypothetical protein ACM3Q2_11050 [Syntrophothermus sp.]